MTDLQYNSGENEFGAPPSFERKPDIATRLVEWKLVSNRDQATYLLIGVGVVALAIAAFFMFSGGGNDAPPLLPQ